MSKKKINNDKLYLGFDKDFVAQVCNVKEAMLKEYEPIEYIRSSVLIDWLNGIKKYDSEINIQSVIDKINLI